MKCILQSLATLFLLCALLTSCDKDDDCVCLNGGICKDGQCDCPDGYEGNDCGEQETPLRMTIHAVRVTKFPAFDSGTNWDVLDGPDIYFQVYNSQGILYDEPTFIEDADPSQDYNLNVASPIQLTNTTGEYGIQLLDYDDGITADDFMGGILFIPYWSSTNGFPTTITLEGTLVSFVLEVSYVW